MRFGFIGLGHAAQWLHLPSVRGVVGSSLVGGVDLSPERRSAWAGLDAGPAFETVDELLTTAEPDIVVVAGPPVMHAEACIAAMQAGAHVICEKPFAETVAQADAVLEAAATTGRQIAVNQEFRYMPIFDALASQVASGTCGAPIFMHVVQLMDLAPWDEDVPWRAAMSHRTLFEGGVHLVDLMYHVLGRLPIRVTSTISSGLDPARDADAVHLVTLDFGQGLLGQITINRLCKAGTRYADVRLDCEDASVRASYGGRAFVQVGIKRAQRPGIKAEFGAEGLAWVERGLTRKTLARNSRHATVRATGMLYQHAVPALLAGKEPPVSGRVARETLRVIEAAYRSADEGRPVALSESE